MGVMMTARRRDKELLLAISLGVSGDDLPGRLLQLKGGASFRRLAKVLTDGWGVPVTHVWLSRYFREHELSARQTQPPE